jgi:hypothetical protein
MTGDFIPFLSKPVTASQGTSHPFAAVGASRSLGADSASGGSGPAKQFPFSASPHSHSEINIEIKRDGDRVSQIRIRCRCGELIELDCEY